MIESTVLRQILPEVDRSLGSCSFSATLWPWAQVQHFTHLNLASPTPQGGLCGFFNCIYLFFFLGCAALSLLHMCFLQLRQVEAVRSGGWYTGFSLQQLLLLWCTGLVALQHVECSWTRDPTCIPCIGIQILNHWTTREVLCLCLM